MPRLDLSRQRFGRLVAIKDVGKHRNGSRMWECLCDCGTSRVVAACNLRNPRSSTQSCGCLRRDNGRSKRLPGNEAGLNALYKQYKTQAGNAGRCFSLSMGEFRRLTLSNCYYCGAGPSQISRSRSDSGADPYVYNGIDRVRNAEGYALDNCVTCCKTCNRMKGAMPQDEFLEATSRITDFQRRSKSAST